MEFKELFPFVLTLVMVGILLGVGLLVLDKFSTAAKTDTAIVNETVTITSAAGELANDFINSVSFIGNTTMRCDLPNAACLNFTSNTGAITVNGTFGDGPWNVSYNYKKSTKASTAVDNTVGALDDIPATWLGLIVTVVVLAIILLLVIRSFGAGGQR